MFRKIFISFVLVVFTLLFLSVSRVRSQEEVERGNFSIYFMEENVGFEEYIWRADEEGYLLSVRGQMTRPAMEIEILTIRLDKDFIPIQFHFKGAIGGIAQEISSSIDEGKVENTILVVDQEHRITAEVKRDAFLLPNPIFSCYMAITKKFRCTLQESVKLSAYIIPQIEVTYTLKPKEEDPCVLLMRRGGIEMELETDDEGKLLSILIPSKKLQVIRKEF